MDTKTISALMELVVKHKIDSLRVSESGVVEITKSKHEQPKAEPQAFMKQEQQLITDNDELLFWSSSSPVLSASQIDHLAANGSGLLPEPKQKKIKRKVGED